MTEPGLMTSLSAYFGAVPCVASNTARSEEHTSELQSQSNLVCRLLLEKKKKDRCTPRAHLRYDIHVRGVLTRTSGPRQSRSPETRVGARARRRRRPHSSRRHSRTAPVP